MNVDLNWCPCGKQSREGSMYCSDTCYLKDLASNGNTTYGFSRTLKNFEKDSFFSSNITIHNYYCDKRNTMKTPDYKNIYENNILSASTNLIIKNRQKYPQNSYYYKNSYMSSNKSFNSMASSYSSTSSTIDDYFKKSSTSSKIENSPKPSVIVITPKEDENAKEKSDVKSCSNRSSYVIEAVYPIQSFNNKKNSITVY